MTDKTFKIEPALLRACAPAMSTEETRYYLMGVNILSKDGKVTYQATNGHILIKIETALEQDEDLEDFNIIVPASMVKQLTNKSFLKALGDENPQWHTAVISGQSLQIECLDGLYQQKLIDGTFPETDKVIPQNATFSGKDFSELGFNLSYMSFISKSLKAFSGNHTAAFAPTDNTGPATFKATCERGEYIAVLMPVRV